GRRTAHARRLREPRTRRERDERRLRSWRPARGLRAVLTPARARQPGLPQRAQVDPPGAGQVESGQVLDAARHGAARAPAASSDMTARAKPKARGCEAVLGTSS